MARPQFSVVIKRGVQIEKAENGVVAERREPYSGLTVT